MYSYNLYRDALDSLSNCEFISMSNTDETKYSDLLENLVERENPVLPIKTQVGKMKSLFCPTCETQIINVWSKKAFKPNYCHFCGQHLDWKVK